MKSIVLAVLTTAVAAFGQSSAPKAIVNIPDDFVTQDKVMPAGRWTVTQPNPNLVVLSSIRTFEAVSMRCRYVDQDPILTEAKLRFRKDGDIMVLHQIVLSDHNYALDAIHGPDVPEMVLAKR